MATLTDSFDLASLGMEAGEGKRISLAVTLDKLVFGDQRYDIDPPRADVVLDVARMVGGGWSLRLRFSARLSGPCMRCLEPATPEYAVDAREIDAPGGGEELDSPYVDADELNVRDWARDALLLALPNQILCRPDCAGLCPVCGADMNADRGHEHEREPDPRWAALRDLKLE